jgi:flotillin
MGKGEGGKIQKGGGAFVLPIVQQWKTLSMEPMALEVKLGSALSLERIRVNIPSVFTVAVSDDDEKRVLAVSRLLTMTRAEIEYQAKEIITGQLRAVVAQMDIDEINLDRKKFNGMIEELVGDELDKIGLQLINVNITDINDASGKIEAQGKKAAAESIEKARVAEAMERRNGASGVAEADKLRETEVAQHVAAKDIGIKESDQMQRERIAAIEATAVEAENEATGRIATSKATLQVTQAEAYEEGESRERESRARVEELEAKAFAEAAKAQAERIEMDKRAELEAPAKAMKSKIITDAEADAEATIINARGKADATFIQMEAEAKGHYELLDKKAQGLGALVAGCGGSDAAFQLLMLEHVDTIAETSAKAISNIKFDKVTVWDTGAGAGNGSSTTADFIRSLTQSLPPTMEVIEKVAGVDLPKLGESKAAKE